MTMIGDRLKSILTGKVYEVKMVKGLSVLLESEDRRSQVLTEKGNLNLFYEKVENKDLSKDSNSLLLPNFKNTDKL
ncbi:MAG: hypothetical protein MUP27_01905 [Desulfobacterales bacterium]|jgi:hypothetical protein|nr:hypothetical protein [Desulfobacterales bacterium]